MNDKNVGTDHRSSEFDHDEDRRLMSITSHTHVWPNSPITPHPYDADSAPGTYYTTIHSTSSRRYK